jgi:hypothetical protein
MKWSPTSIFDRRAFGIAGLSYNNTAKTIFCNTYSTAAGAAIAGTGLFTNGGGGGGAVVGTCDPGFTISMIGLVTRWTPVKNLTFSAEALYAYLKTNMSGTVTGTPSSTQMLPNTTYNYGNNGNASLSPRVQRNF